ncbi:MAG: hypothetical protein EP343_31340 [Deltaproteobacteria bacterium]|nr:MAG: hypothetical protein EP343_31340 [Deltaproteobacteria bacterium]
MIRPPVLPGSSPTSRWPWALCLLVLFLGMSGCQWAEKALNKVLQSTSKPTQRNECASDKDCRAKKLYHCVSGRCLFCRHHKDCAIRNPALPYCVFQRRCVRCVVDQHCALLQRCWGEQCQRDKDKEWAMATVLLLLGFFFPLLQRYSLAGSPDMMLKTGIFCLMAGALLGGITPVYLELDPWTRWLFAAGGGAMVWTMGLSPIAAYWLDDAGFALGFCGLAWSLHYAINNYVSVFGTGPMILKAGVMLFLLLSSGFLIAGLDFQRKETGNKRNLGKVVVTVIGGIFTAIEFVNLIMDFLRRSSQS